MRNNVEILVTHIIALFLIIICAIILNLFDPDNQNNTEMNPITKESFGGYLPSNIVVYQIYDKDTGVYYAVTNKGGICVMETMFGETKLVDQGDGKTIHKNKN